MTTEILEEYEEILGGFYSPVLAANIVELLVNLQNAIMITPYYKWALIWEDADDNKYVDCAIACQADYIITHDKHFNVLRNLSFPKVKILSLNELQSLLNIL